MEEDEENGCLSLREKPFASSDTDGVLPPLESATVKKLNATNAAEQKRFEKLECQLKREKHDAKVRLFLQQKGFVRSSLVLKEWRQLNSGGTDGPRSLVDARRRETELGNTAKGGLNRHSDESTSSEIDSGLPRPPVILQPIHTQVTMDLKQLQSQRVEIEKSRKNVDVKTIKRCRYLRVNFEERGTEE